MGKVKVIKDDWSDKLIELFDIDSNPKWVNSKIQSNEIKSVVPKDFLNGVTVEIEGSDREQLEIRHEEDSYLELEMTSWVGVSPGAVHCYGTLTIKYIDVGEVGKPNSSLGGYLGAPQEEFPLAFKFESLKVKIVRPITQKDIDYAKGDRYVGYELGEMTRDFWTVSALEKEGKRIAKKYFPDYRLEIEDKT